MADPAPSYHFLPWVRSGLAAMLETGVPIDPDSGRARLDVAVHVVRGSGAVPPVEQRLQVMGPGDVVGLDPRQVIRTDPHAGATDFEPNFLVQVELDRPDLPWLFTPEPAVSEQLRPWLVLVVVAIGPGVRTYLPTGAPLPVLELDVEAEPARQLPDLAESWAWAHGQAVVLPGENTDAVLDGVPGRNASRLLCPRRLDPLTRYVACLVPAFEAGRRAGLGLDPHEEGLDPLAPAWTSATASSGITLPVYHSFEFTTGVGGDFESLARALRPRELPPGVGWQPVYVGAAGAPLPELPGDAPDGTVLLPGALVMPESTAPEWPAGTLAAVRDGLRGLVDTPARRRGATGGAGGPDDEPAVTPPLYGQWPAARPSTPVAAEEPVWLTTLNLDPRHRAVAGVAAQIVTAEQERLMDEAWAQVGEVEEANRALRWAQLAREVRASMLRRHLVALPPGEIVSITAAAHGRLPARDGTLAGAVTASSLPDAVVTAAFRRAVGPRSPLLRRLQPAGERTVRPMAERLDAGELAMPRSVAAPDGLFNLARAQPARGGVPAEILERLAAARETARMRRPKKPNPVVLVNAPIKPQQVDAVTRLLRIPGHPSMEAAVRFRDAAVAGLQRARAVADVPPDPPRPALGIAEIASSLLAQLDPAVTVGARVQHLIERPDGLQPRPERDPLEEIMVAPVFGRPAWELVRDHAHNLLLPGLERIPQDTATLAEPNAAFTEALLVGLNHEMARELLWREYPSNQRGTSFHRFWAPGGADDIGELHTWTEGDLGAHSVVGAGDWLVLVLRGRLLFRYPGTVIYAAPDSAGRPNLTEDAARTPAFRGSVGPDLAFCGFELSVVEARGTPGWWFVLEQQPTAPRFGLDVASGFGPDAGPVHEWNDLSWGHLAPDAEGLAALSHLRADLRPPSPPAGPRWGRSAAGMAAILAQQPVRIALRAVDLLPAPRNP